jgi:hypothetical protein
VRTLQYFQKKKKKIFAYENIKKRASIVAHNGPQTFFSEVRLGCSNQPKIDFSYCKYVPRLICLLICGLQLQINPLHNTWNVNCKGYETIFAKTCLVENFSSDLVCTKHLLMDCSLWHLILKESKYPKCFIELLGMKLWFLTFGIEFQKSDFQPSSISIYSWFIKPLSLLHSGLKFAW